MKLLKIIRTTLIVLGAILIVLNSFVYTSNSFTPPENESTTNIIAYMIGWNASYILGGIFLVIAYVMGKRIKRKENKEIIDSFLKD